MDARLFEWISAWRGKSAALDAFMLVFELHTLRYILLALILVCAFSKQIRLQKGALVAVAAVAASILLRPFYKGIVHRDRPWVEYGCTDIVPCYPDSSFPSGHAFLVFAILVPIWRADRTAGLITLPIGIVMCISRVYLAEHWPSDLVVGALLGGLTGYALSRLSDVQPFSRWVEHALARAGAWRERTLARLRPAQPEAAPSEP